LEVKDTKTWIFNEIKISRRHENYSDIVHYRDDGDAKWHKRMDSIIDVMTKTNIQCGDLYRQENHISKWIQKSSQNQSPKRTYNESGLGSSYPEWGTINKDNIAYTPTDTDDTINLEQDSCHNTHPPTLDTCIFCCTLHKIRG